MADAISGGVIARAVEPRAGDARAGEAHAGEAGHTHETACLNCGTALTGSYCHACGQHAHVHRTLAAFGHDLLHGVLHFEGKIWLTLPMLVWRPGRLTRRYVAGERARFVSPLALFLFALFLTFAVFGWTGGPLAFNTGPRTLQIQNSLAEEQAGLEKQVAEFERERAADIAAGRPVTRLDAKITETRDSISMMQMTRDKGITEATMTRASDDFGTGLKWLDAAFQKAKANPSLLIYKLQNNAYKYGWALIPISLPFMWLLFPFDRRFRMYDHAVFVTYSLCFVTLMLVALSLLRAAGGHSGFAVLAMSILPPVHMYRQMREAYRLRWWSALIRTIMLAIFATTAAVLFMLMLIALGVLG